MLVRLKNEIIAFGVESVDPRKETSPRLQVKELKRWLDEGRPVTLLDTRNDYDAFGRRVVQEFSGTQIIHVGADFEYDTASNRSTKYFHVNGERVATRARYYRLEQQAGGLLARQQRVETAVVGDEIL